MLLQDLFLFILFVYLLLLSFGGWTRKRTSLVAAAPCWLKGQLLFCSLYNKWNIAENQTINSKTMQLEIDRLLDRSVEEDKGEIWSLVEPIRFVWTSMRKRWTSYLSLFLLPFSLSYFPCLLFISSAGVIRTHLFLFECTRFLFCNFLVPAIVFLIRWYGFSNHRQRKIKLNLGGWLNPYALAEAGGKATCRVGHFPL